MKKSVLVLMVALTACTARTPLSLDIVRNCVDEYPQEWNCVTGMELKALLDAAPEETFDRVDSWYDALIDSTGTISGYQKEDFSLSQICPGRTLFQLYDVTGKEKYRAAMDSLYTQLWEQPRNPEGGFWHSGECPHQMWLEDLYMAEPFYAEYTVRYVTDSLERAENFQDIAHQFGLAFDATFDHDSGLLREAWDSSKDMLWSDEITGQSPSSYAYDMGLYAMALVDVIEIMPSGEEHDELVRLFNRVFDPLPLYADAQTGMWFQVMDSPYEEGNPLDATGSAMFTYSLLKGTRLGVLEGFTGEDAATRYQEFLDTFVHRNEEGGFDLESGEETSSLIWASMELSLL